MGSFTARLARGRAALVRFCRDSGGAASAEYVLLFAILGGGLAVGAFYLGGKQSEALTQAGNNLLSEASAPTGTSSSGGTSTGGASSGGASSGGASSGGASSGGASSGGASSGGAGLGGAPGQTPGPGNGNSNGNQTPGSPPATPPGKK